MVLMKKYLALHWTVILLLETKMFLIGQYLREEKNDFAVFTETWSSDEKQHQIDTSDLNQNGYTMSTVNRSSRIGGGVALTCRTWVTVRKVSSSKNRTFEHGIWQLILKNITINVVGVYRPQS